MLPCAAVCCSVLQCVAVCCSVLHYYLLPKKKNSSVMQCAAVCCSVLQCAAACCSALQGDAVCCRVLQCVAVCHRVHSATSQSVADCVSQSCKKLFAICAAGFSMYDMTHSYL